MLRNEQLHQLLKYMRENGGVGKRWDIYALLPAFKKEEGVTEFDIDGLCEELVADTFAREIWIKGERFIQFTDRSMGAYVSEIYVRDLDIQPFGPSKHRSSLDPLPLFRERITHWYHVNRKVIIGAMSGVIVGLVVAYLSHRFGWV